MNLAPWSLALALAFATPPLYLDPSSPYADEVRRMDGDVLNEADPTVEAVESVARHLSFLPPESVRSLRTAADGVVRSDAPWRATYALPLRAQPLVASVDPTSVTAAGRVHLDRLQRGLHAQHALTTVLFPLGLPDTLPGDPLHHATAGLDVADVELDRGLKAVPDRHPAVESLLRILDPHLGERAMMQMALRRWALELQALEDTEGTLPPALRQVQQMLGERVLDGC